MSGSLLEVLTENERRANRSCAVAGLWTAAVCAIICLIGLTGAFGISRCRERAARDSEFAALVERDPAAAVREVQG